MTKPIALQICETQNLNFQYGFRYQYVVGPDRLDLPGFHTERVGSQWVHVGQDLRRAQLYDGQGRPFGMVLGIAVDHDGKTPEEVISKIVPNADAPGAQEALERYIAYVAGRYAFIVLLGDTTWYYCDPVGMIGAVTARETRRIGASPGLCIDRPYREPELYDNVAIAEGRGTYGFNHTRDRHVFRHNASHRLNLEQFCASRFWPRPDDVFDAQPDAYGAIYDEIIAAGGKIVARMTRLGDTALPISGGNDSRLIPSVTDEASRPKLTQIFTHISKYANRRDNYLGALQCDLSPRNWTLQKASLFS